MQGIPGGAARARSVLDHRRARALALLEPLSPRPRRQLAGPRCAGCGANWLAGEPELEKSSKNNTTIPRCAFLCHFGFPIEEFSCDLFSTFRASSRTFEKSDQPLSGWEIGAIQSLELVGIPRIS